MYQHKHPKADGERAMAGMTLRMADGGFFSKLKPNFLKSGNERFAEAQAQAKTTSTPAQRPTMAPVTAGTRFDPSVALRQREAAAGLRDGGELRMQSGGTIPMLPPKDQTPIPDFMRRNQFKDGGEVPGEGEGDKVPALYEPGEFVVSNDMLDDAPGLRNQLHELREDALAKRGKTVAEADEAAYSGEPLRANDGVDPLKRYPAVYDSEVVGGTNENNGRLRSGVQAGDESLRGATTRAAPPRVDGVYRADVPGTGSAGSVRPDSVKTAGTYSPEASAYRNERYGQAGPPRPTPPASSTAPQGSLLRQAAEGAGRGAAEVTKRTKNNLRDATTTGHYGPFLAATAAAETLRTYNETPEDDYYRRFGLDPNDRTIARDIGTRLGGMATDFGSHLLDTPVNLFNAVTGKDVQLPGGSFRDIVTRQDNPTNAAASSLRESAPKAQAQNPGVQAQNPGVQAPTAFTAPDTSTRSLRQGNYTVPAGEFGPEAGVVYRKGNSFSGRDVSGYVGSGKNPIGIVPGMSKELIDETLRNPDGSRWSAADNATMAANIRDGVDPYLGTSRQAGQDRARADANIERLALSEAGTPGRRAAMKILADREQNAVTLRGQDITASGQAQTARNAAASAAALKAQQDRQYELDVAKFGQEAANKKRDDKRAGDAAFDTRIKGLVGDDADGTKAAGIRTAANAFLANKQAEMEAALKADPNNKRAAAILKDIQENGVSGMDEDTLRNLTLGTKANQLAQENDSAWWNPFGGTAKNTSTPVTSLRQQKNMIFPNQDITDNGQIIPSRVVEENPDLLRLRR